MANMSYCRFENTSNDLSDCKDALKEMLDGECTEPLNEYELPAAKRLVADCLEIVLLLAEAANVRVGELDHMPSERLLVEVIDKTNDAVKNEDGE